MSGARDAVRLRLAESVARPVPDVINAKALDEDVAAVAAGNSVPYLARLRFTDAGLEKHAEWQRTWQAQRAEDAGQGAPGAIPPRYKSTDFRSARFWQLRGKLDVPKERFISYPGCESDEDGEPVYGWAGWESLSSGPGARHPLLKRKTEEGWTAERLTPMLAGLLELLPWVKQWHIRAEPGVRRPADGRLLRAVPRRRVPGTWRHPCEPARVAAGQELQAGRSGAVLA